MPTPNEHPPAPGLVERLEALMSNCLLKQFSADQTEFVICVWCGTQPLAGEPHDDDCPASMLPEIIATLRAQAAERGKRIKELEAELRDFRDMSWEDATS